MDIKKSLQYCILILLGLLIMGCTGDMETAPPPDDYREQWIGSYEGTKSNTSLEDELMTTPISFEVTMDESTVDGLIVNGTLVPIAEDGTFGPDFVEGGPSNYEVHFMEDGSVTIKINEIFPFGIALPCYINARRT